MEEDESYRPVVIGKTGADKGVVSTGLLDGYYCVFIHNPKFMKPHAIFQDRYEAKNWYKMACFTGEILTFKEWRNDYKPESI